MAEDRGLLNPDMWRDCVNRFIEHKLSKKRLRNGENDYRYILADERPEQWGGYYRSATKKKRFYPWLVENNITHPTAADAERYFRYLEKRGARLTTVNKVLYVVRDFFRYLNENDIYPNSSGSVTAYKLDNDNTHIREYLTPKMFVSLISTIDTTTVKGARDKAIIFVAFSTGARIGSIIALKRRDFVYSKQDNIYHLRFAVKKRRATESETFEEIPNITGEVIQAYFKALEREKMETKPDEPLFISLRNSERSQPLLQTTVSHIVKEYFKALVNIGEIDKSELHLYTAHSLRHGFASFVNDHFGIYEAGLLADQKSIETTKRYIHTKKKKVLRQQVNRIFADAIIKIDSSE